MKVPDKIYLREFKGVGLAQVWSGIKPTEETIVASHEYIHKDTLMEWLKDRQKHYRKRADDIADTSNPDLPFFEGKENAFTEVIDKIESL